MDSLRSTMSTSKKMSVTLRISSGEILLLTASFMVFVLVFQLYAVFWDPEYIFEEHTTAFLRNTGILVGSFVIGSLLSYGYLWRRDTRRFMRSYTRDAWVNSYKPRTFLFGKIVGYILIAFGLFNLLSMSLIWDPSDVEGLISGYLPFLLPPLIFGSKWSQQVDILLIRSKRLQSEVGTAEKEHHVLRIEELEYTTVQVDPRFNVTKPTIGSWVLIFGLAIGLSLIITSTLSILIISGALISLLVSLLLWSVLGYFILSRVFLVGFPKTMPNINDPASFRPRDIGPFRRISQVIYGLSINPDQTYYLKADVDDLDLNRVLPVFRKRIIEVVFSGMAVAFIVLRLLEFGIGFSSRYTDGYDFLVDVAAILVLSPILLFAIIPVIWTIDDMGIYIYDKSKSIIPLINLVRRSQLQRVLGLTGFFAGIDFYVTIFEIFPELSAFNGVWPNLTTKYIDAALSLIYISFSFAGIAYTIGILYLNFLHERNVNKARIFLMNYISFAEPKVRRLTGIEQKQLEPILELEKPN